MLEEEMLTAAENLDFEKAAKLRDQAKAIKEGKIPTGLESKSGGKMRRSEVEEVADKGGKSKAGMPGTKVSKRRKKG